MKIKFTMTSGVTREAPADEVDYDHKHAVFSAGFMCSEKGYSEFLYIRLIHIKYIECISG